MMVRSLSLLILALVGLGAAAPVYMMLPLDTVDGKGLKDPSRLLADLTKLKSTGIKGVMVDVWWGLTETTARGYNFTGYLQLVEMVSSIGLKLQPVMSFHACGGNVGDTCDFPIPSWVRAVGDSVFYTDREGSVDREYISLGADRQAVFGGRTPLDLYGDFMSAFAKTFSNHLGSTIDEILVGLGPASELRYPSYRKPWEYCGVGEVQCYDKYMLADLKSSAAAAGHADWGYGGPSNAGTYNSRPSQTGFFANGNDNYSSAYGKFFLGWYSGVLIRHATDVLSRAKAAFGSRVPLGVKVSGIHWWYGDNSHAAELTAGYYNANGNNAYLSIAQAIKPYVRTFDFTCMEMTNSGNNCASQPEDIVAQAASGAHNGGVEFGGENALELCNPYCYAGGFDQIVKQASKNRVSAFTYLRMTRNLVDNDQNINIFKNFVSKMASI